MRLMLIVAALGMAACSVPQQDGKQSAIMLSPVAAIGPTVGMGEADFLFPTIVISAPKAAPESSKEKRQNKQKLALIKRNEALCEIDKKDDLREYINSRLDCALELTR